MSKILIGLAIALLDFELQFAGGRALDLTPDVLGYILVFLGIREIGKYSLKFSTAYKLACFAAIAAGIVFVTKLAIGEANMSTVIVLLGIAEMILQIVLLYFLATGFQDMEQDFDIPMQSKWLKIIAICMIPGIILGYAGLLLEPLKLAGSLIMDISCFAYLIPFYFAKEAYEDWLLTEE